MWEDDHYIQMTARAGLSLHWKILRICCHRKHVRVVARVGLEQAEPQ